MLPLVINFSDFLINENRYLRHRGQIVLLAIIDVWYETVGPVLQYKVVPNKRGNENFAFPHWVEEKKKLSNTETNEAADLRIKMYTIAILYAVSVC